MAAAENLETEVAEQRKDIERREADLKAEWDEMQKTVNTVDAIHTDTKKTYGRIKDMLTDAAPTDVEH